MNIRMIFFSLVVLGVCVAGTFTEMHAELLSVGKVSGSDVRLQLISVENNTESLEFKLVHSDILENMLVFPQSTLQLSQPALLQQRDKVALICTKGSFVPVFIQDGGWASGMSEDGYDGPFYISMWLQYPSVPESAKTRVRYVVHKEGHGSIGIKIGNNGDYRFVAHDGVKFLP